jgi:hypothetical protein
MQRQVKKTTGPALKRYTARLLQLLRQAQSRVASSNPELRPRALSLSEGARRLWIKFADECEMELSAGGKFEPIRGFANKLPEHALRIAAVLEVVEDINAPRISAGAMDRGITIAWYYASEALRLFEQGSSSMEIQRAEKVLKWLHERWGKPIVALPHIYQFGPNSIRDQARAQEAVSILVQHHWLYPIQGGAEIDGKRHREAWEIVAR